VIRARATEVILDVVVRDKHHHVVRDLRPFEVKVYEDGVLQKVKAFRDVQGSEQVQNEKNQARADAVAKAVETSAPASDVTPPASTLRQLNFVSVVFGEIETKNLEFAREAVHEFLKSDDLENTYVTLYRLNRTLQLIHPYTDDKDLLAKSIDRATKGVYKLDDLGLDATVSSAAKAELQSTASNIIASPISGPATVLAVENAELNPVSSILLDPNWSRNAASQDASVSVGHAFITQADMEKGLRFSTSLASGMNTMDSLRALVRSQERLPGRRVVLYLADGLRFPVNRREVVDGLISYANRASVTFYTIDTRGLKADDRWRSRSPPWSVCFREHAQRADPRNGHMQDDDEGLAALPTISSPSRAPSQLADLRSRTRTRLLNRCSGWLKTCALLRAGVLSLPRSTYFRKIDVRVARRKVSFRLAAATSLCQIGAMSLCSRLRSRLSTRSMQTRPLQLFHSNPTWFTSGLHQAQSNIRRPLRFLCRA
jgi:VWFA-related protein